MKKTLIVLLLSVSTLAQAQVLGIFNQNWVVGAGVIVNLIRSPQELIQVLSKPSLRKRYQNYVIKNVDDDTANLQVDSDENMCSQVCPSDFSIFKDAYQKMQPDTGEHLLDFLNEKKKFRRHHQRTLGYCWGHTTLTRKFNYLAYFDEDNKQEEFIPSKKNMRKWRRFYKKKIKRIMRGKATYISGFKNLREFTADPDILKMTKLKTVRSWWSHAVRMSAVPVFLTNFKRPMNIDEISTLIKDIEFKLSNYITPKIYMANMKKPMFMHIISVYNVIHDEDGSTRICILDNHQYEDELRGCQTYLRAYPDGRLYYPGWEEPETELEGWVRRFGYTPEDLRETVKFAKQRIKMCKQLTKCQQETLSPVTK